MARDNFEIMIPGELTISGILDDDMPPESFSIRFVGPLTEPIVCVMKDLEKLQLIQEPLLITIKPKSIEVSCKPAGAGSESEHKE